MGGGLYRALQPSSSNGRAATTGGDPSAAAAAAAVAPPGPPSAPAPSEGEMPSIDTALLAFRCARI